MRQWARRDPTSARGGNEARADDDVFLVEHCRLPRRDAVGRGVQTDAKTAGLGRHAGRDSGREVAELGFRPLDRNEEPTAAYADLVPGQSGPGADDDRIRARLGPERV